MEALERNERLRYPRFSFKASSTMREYHQETSPTCPRMDAAAIIPHEPVVLYQ